MLPWFYNSVLCWFLGLTPHPSSNASKGECLQGLMQHLRFSVDSFMPIQLLPSFIFSTCIKLKSGAIYGNISSKGLRLKSHGSLPHALADFLHSTEPSTGSLQPNSVGIALSNIQDTQQWVMFSDNPPPPGAVPTCTKLQWLLK